MDLPSSSMVDGADPSPFYVTQHDNNLWGYCVRIRADRRELIGGFFGSGSTLLPIKHSVHRLLLTVFVAST
jgi:hypothetical protein